MMQSKVPLKFNKTFPSHLKQFFPISKLETIITELQKIDRASHKATLLNLLLPRMSQGKESLQ